MTNYTTPAQLCLKPNFMFKKKLRNLSSEASNRQAI